MGLFDRDTDMSDDEPSDSDAPDGDDPGFEPVEGTAPAGGDDGFPSDGDDDGGEPSPFDRLEAVRLRDDDFNGTLKRAVDWEAGVVLYAYGNGNAGSLAAVPLARTEFDRE